MSPLPAENAVGAFCYRIDLLTLGHSPTDVPNLSVLCTYSAEIDASIDPERQFRRGAPRSRRAMPDSAGRATQEIMGNARIFIAQRMVWKMLPRWRSSSDRYASNG